MFFKNIQKNLSPFLCKKTIKECPVPLDISIKSNRKHHKTVLYSKSNKNMVGPLFGRFFIVFGWFFMVSGEFFFLEKVAQWFGRNFSHEKIAQNWP